jgi:hypothetical protein
MPLQLVNTSRPARVSSIERNPHPKGATMKLSATKFAAFLFTLSLFAASAFAGPPLICHTYDIGNAKSLPWIGHNWNLTGSESYDTNNLAADTLSILDSDSTVLVHMETLRRAALYGQKNPQALKQLLVKLIARSDTPTKDAKIASLVSFDLGYLAATLAQVHLIYKDFANPAQSLDARALVDKGIRLRGKDPQMEFAAALITLDGPAEEHNAHAQEALLGAKSDALLASNLSTHFMSSDSETMAHVITRNANVKAAQQ